MSIPDSLRPFKRGLFALIREQEFRCAYCHKTFLLNGNRHSARAPTVDHVWPRNLGNGRVWNIVAVHKRCNEAKGGRLPNGCELLALEAVNARRRPGCVGLLPGQCASGMSAGTAETQSGSGLQPASPTAKGGDAQGTSA